MKKDFTHGPLGVKDEKLILLDRPISFCRKTRFIAYFKLR
jgi:hypothetical protein